MVEVSGFSAFQRFCAVGWIFQNNSGFRMKEAASNRSRFICKVPAVLFFPEAFTL